MMRIVDSIKTVLSRRGRAWICCVLALLGACLLWSVLGSAAWADPYPRVIAHGGGSVQGEPGTNSLEALEQSIADGYRYIELDMAFTSDGKVAMLHDWESATGYYLGIASSKAISYRQYTQCSILNRYTPLTLDSLAEVLRANPQISVITDTKEDNLALLSHIADEQPDILPQIIPQIYSYEECAPVQALGYERVILTLYKMPQERDGHRIARFVKEHGLFAVTMAAETAGTGLAKTLQSYGVAVYVHTVNSLADTVRMLNLGAYGIYSDRLLPDEVTYPGWQYYLARSDNAAQQLSLELQQGRLRLNMRSSLAGTNQGSTVAYYIGERELVRGPVGKVLEADVSAIATGSHTVTARLSDRQGRRIAEKTYLIWKDQNCVLLLSPQCRYVLEQFTALGDFRTALERHSARAAQLAEESVFARRGSAVYYNRGKVGLYLSGNALLPAIAADSQGNIYTSLYDTALALGASSAQMNNTYKTMELRVRGGTRQAGISGLTARYRKDLPVMRTKVQLYRNRAMGSGAFYQELTGRAFLQEDGFLILLPEGASVSEAERQELLEIARQLYQ